MYQIGDRVFYQGCLYAVASVSLESERAKAWQCESRGDAYNLYKVEHIGIGPCMPQCLRKAFVWEYELERIQP